MVRHRSQRQDPEFDPRTVARSLCSPDEAGISQEILTKCLAGRHRSRNEKHTRGSESGFHNKRRRNFSSDSYEPSDEDRRSRKRLPQLLRTAREHMSVGRSPRSQLCGRTSDDHTSKKHVHSPSITDSSSRSEDLLSDESTYSERDESSGESTEETVPKGVTNVVSGRYREEDEDDHMQDDNASSRKEVNKVFRVSRGKLDDGEIISILKKAEKGKLNEFVMQDPPFQPKAGEIFLCRSTAPQEWDYRRDGYTGFKCRGDNLKSEKTELTRYYSKLVNNKNHVIPGFERNEYLLRNCLQQKDRIVMVHYIGSEKIWKPRPHGNSKSGKIFTANTKKVRSLIREKIRDTGKSSQGIYEDLKRIGSRREDHPEREATCGVRDRKQVENENENVKNAKRIFRDEFFSVYEMVRSNRLPGMLKYFIAPDEAIVLAEPETLKLAHALLDEARKDSSLPQCISYDTTFDILDGYVSPLVMRNTYLKDNPTFVVACLIHEKRTEVCHDVFFREMAEVLFTEPIPDSVPIVTDREAGMSKAIFNRLPKEVQVVYCNNHIYQNALQFVKRTPGSHKDDKVILPQEIDTILQSPTEEDFDQNYEYFSGTWTQVFKEYVDKHLKEDMRKHAAAFYTKKFPCFQGIDTTNNACEGTHSVIKRRSEFKTLRIDSAIYMLFNFMMSRLQEFHRAYSPTGVGNYVLKESYRTQTSPFKLPRYAYWTEDEFFEVFKDGLYEPQKMVEKEGNYLQGKSAVAKLACKLQYVSLNSQTLSYVVTDPYSLERHTVEEINMRLRCTCPDSSICIHKLAYLHVTRKHVIEDKCSWKLAKLRSKTRKFRGRSGKKHLQKEDFYDVIEAPDSEVARRKKALNDEGISSPDDELVVEAPFNPRANYSISSRRQPTCDEFTSQAPVRTVNHNTSFSTQHSRDEDSISHVTAPLSVSSDGTTPLEFRLNPDPPPVNQALLRTPTYKCLQDGEDLMTDIVDDMVALMILVHGMDERISLADTTMWKQSWDSIEDSSLNLNLLASALKIQALNSSVLLVNIRVETPPHFLLAAVLIDNKEIVLVNSMPNCPEDMQKVVFGVLRIIGASYYVAGLQFNPNEWKVFQETESAIQVGGNDCGLYVIVNSWAICKRRRFYTAEDVPESSHLRAWVLSCLTHESVDKPVQLRVWKKPQRLPRGERDMLINLMTQLRQGQYEINFRSMASSIKVSIKEPNYIDGKCGSVDCPGEEYVSGRSVMCTSCRSWLHLGSCVEARVARDTFFICNACECRKL